MKGYKAARVKGATTSCRNTWDNVLYFGLSDLPIILYLWSSILPLTKLLAIQEHTRNSKVKGGRRWVLFLTNMWLAAIWGKIGRPLYYQNVSKFSQPVVASGAGVGWGIKIPGGIERVMGAMRWRTEEGVYSRELKRNHRRWLKDTLWDCGLQREDQEGGKQID